MQLKEDQFYKVLAKIALKVQIWLQEAQSLHKLLTEQKIKASRFETKVGQLEDKLRSFEKTEDLLDKSLS